MAKSPEMEIDTNTIYTVTLGTSKGTIVMDLDPRLAPRSVNHFVVLAKRGFYTGLTFHRVVPDFVIQGGDPEGSGRGGPGYKWDDEPVKAEYQSATMEEIARGMMPAGWRVEVEFSNRPELADRRYQFISTDPRDLALRKLTSSVRDARVRFAYFWDLTDANGNPAPMLLITDRDK